MISSFEFDKRLVGLIRVRTAIATWIAILETNRNDWSNMTRGGNSRARQCGTIRQSDVKKHWALFILPTISVWPKFYVEIIAGLYVVGLISFRGIIMPFEMRSYGMLLEINVRPFICRPMAAGIAEPSLPRVHVTLGMASRCFEYFHAKCAEAQHSETRGSRQCTPGRSSCLPSSKKIQQNERFIYRRCAEICSVQMEAVIQMGATTRNCKNKYNIKYKNSTHGKVWWNFSLGGWVSTLVL